MNIKKMMWMMSSTPPKVTDFKRLNITNWKQFESINIEFHDKLTILTGSNASGKTTILNLLAKHYDWPSVELATPVIIKGVIQFIARLFGGDSESDSASSNIGEIEYENTKTALLQISNSNEIKFSIGISGRQKVDGFYVPTYRPGFYYHNVDSASLISKNNKQLFTTYFNSIKSKATGLEEKPSNYYIKEALLTWYKLWKDDPDLESNQQYKKYFDGFQEILLNSLPKVLEFKNLEIRESEIVLVTRAGDYLLDSCSGGISMLIDLYWQIYLFSLQSDKKFTVIIDEIENHLHPSMQREVLPQLLSTFGNIKFIVATHSPLIIGSVKNSNVYALRYYEFDNDTKRVKSELLDLVNKPKTASEILNEVLGVPFTLPLWVEASIDNIVNKYSKEPISEDSFDKMRDELKQIGLEDMMPQAMKSILKND